MTRTISNILGAVMTLAGIAGLAMGGSIAGILTAGTALSALWIIAGVVTLAIGLWMPGSSMLWAKIAGVVLVILAILGFVMSGPVAGYLDNTMADNVLHLRLGVLFLWAGFMGGSRASSMGSMPTQAPMQ